MSLQNEHIASVNQELFNALADPTRRTIIELLARNGQMSATDIYTNFSISHPAVSQHLKILREADLVKMEKNAQKHLYNLNPNTMRNLKEWIRQTTDLWDQRLDTLDNILEAEKQRMRRTRR